MAEATRKNVIVGIKIMKYEKDLVSVVIPTHNRENLIERAIYSALRQTYKNIEVIVISDGSEDKTDEVVENLKRTDPRLNFISYYPGQGGNHARNTGIKEAKGEWIAFLDDDDEWHPDKIEKQLECVKENSEIGLVCTAVNVVDDATGKSIVFLPNAPTDCSKKILMRNCIGSTTTVMAKHQLLDDFGMFDEALKAKQDYDLWIRLCQHTKVAVVKTPCVEYHNLATNNQISWNYAKYAVATEYIEQKYQSLYNEKLSPKEIQDYRCRVQFSLARKAIKTGMPKVARQIIVKTVKISFKPKAILYYFASFMPLRIVTDVRMRTMSIFGK